LKLRVLQFELEDANEEVVRVALNSLRPVMPVLEELEPPLPVVAARQAGHVRIGRPKKLLAHAPVEVANGVQMRAAPGGGESIRQRILALLAKKPMSSIEIATALKLEPKQAYQSCAAMKSAGSIDGRNDETDGTRRWFLK
jgi:hypothetical protein